MNAGRLVFTQVIDDLDRKEFDRCVKLHPMRRNTPQFSARDQFLSMVFAQLTYREGLRDIEACLRWNQNAYGMGFRGNITRSNLAYANLWRDWRVYEALAQVLIRKTKRLYAAEKDPIGLNGMVVAVDSSTIDLCLTLFPWADFRKTKAAVKIHTQMDLQGSIPLFIDVTKGREHDVSFLDRMPVAPGTIYVMDRGYLDFARLFRLGQAGAFFVIRAKRNLDFHVRESRKVAKNTGLRSDQTIRLSGALSKERYPIALRRVHFFDEETGKDLVFLSNDFSIPALTVALVYKSRWQIELFFKWIKQNLRIKSFFGTSDNAVRTQIWIAICTYLLVASLKKTLPIDHSLTRILQVLSVNAFQKVSIHQILTESFTNFDKTESPKQLIFNDFLIGQ